LAAVGRPQLLSNIALAAWLSADAVRVLLLAEDLAGQAVEIAAAFAVLAAAWFVLRRPRPLAQDARPATVAVAVSAVLVPGLMSMLAPADAEPGVGLMAVQALAVLLMGAGIVCLGRNFSVLPQYRVLVTHGPYALVRHPIYAAYLMFDGALAVQSASALGAALWLAEATLLALRARAEERLIEASDPTYAQYKARVRYRLVPFLV
jgi:protein-S-isoprenylcysteine O-methyltransferase Ste14